jgi:hypothetical protein
LIDHLFRIWPIWLDPVLSFESVVIFLFWINSRKKCLDHPILGHFYIDSF